jgi:hypothetical protein
VFCEKLIWRVGDIDAAPNTLPLMARSGMFFAGIYPLAEALDETPFKEIG